MTLWRRLLDLVPLTGRGALVVAAAGGGLWSYGVRQQDLVLYVAGWGTLGIAALALLLVVTTALVLRWVRLPVGALQPSCEAEQPIETGFSLPALSGIPLVAFRWEWAEPVGATVELVTRQGRLCERVVFMERGEHRQTVRRIVVEDVLGLARMAVRRTEPGLRTVLPARGRALTVPLMQALVGGDRVSHPAGPPVGDLIEMRRYAPGDPMKRILWKTYAKSRSLMVRLPERAVEPAQRTLVYLVAGEGDEPAAALVRMAIEAGLFGDEWRFGADGSSSDARRLEEALPLIVRSQAARAVGGQGFADFLERAANEGQRGARCVLFAPAQGGPWLEPLLEPLQRRRAAISVVLGMDGVAERREATWRDPRWWILRRESQPLIPAEQIDQISARLSGAGARVMWVDRRSGRHRVWTARRMG